MRRAAASGEVFQLPPELRAVPIHPADERIPLRLCVLARAESDPVAGRLFQLRDLPGARVFLGVVCDAGSRVREWVEIWLQAIDGLAATPAARRENLSNLFLDKRWANQCQAMREWSPETWIETGWETRHPSPGLIDLHSFTMVRVAGMGADNDANWELCQDDALLEAAGLPPYRTSLARYLHQPAEGKASRFVPVAGETIENAATVPVKKAFGAADKWIPFNTEAGLMMVTGFAPFGYDDFSDLLSGKPWGGVTHGKTRIQLGGPYADLVEGRHQQNTGGRFFLDPFGQTGRIVETLHLKLQLLADAFRLTQASVAANQLPLLNVSAASFRVRLSEISSRLPFLWTARTVMVQPTRALPVRIRGTDKRLFVRAGASDPSIFLPEGQVAGGHGQGTLRLRRVVPHDNGTLIVEGTLVPQELARTARRDMLWIRVPLGADLVDLYGHIDAESLAFSEIRFRTIPQRLPESAQQKLAAGDQVAFPLCQFEIVPVLSSPCDLYSLAVLAIRTFLVREKRDLPLALDEMLSLTHQVALEHKPDVSLPDRIAVIFGKKADWMKSLGPHRLLAEELSPADTASLIPSALWHEVLAVMVRLFPGGGPDSYCADLGDAPPLALETIFDRPLDDLDKLLLKTRSLIVIDWNLNREIAAAIEEFRKP